MPELFVEILSEDMPARMQARAAEDFRGLVLARLDQAGLAHGTAEVHVTPRRLALAVADIAERTPDRREERRGPRVGAPAPAVDGFLRAAGLASLDQAERRMTDKGEMWFAVTEVPGQAAAELLPRLVVEAMLALSWPKSMRWRDTRLAWVRPIRSLVGLFGGAVLTGGLDLGINAEGGSQPGFAAGGEGPSILSFGDRTAGHRFLAPEPFTVTSFADYRAKLARAKVMLDAGQRRALILERAQHLAAERGLTLVDDPGLADEVAGLVEWPVPLLGSIDARFMDLPAEVLTASMRAHQKYFVLRDAAGRMAPHFVIVANIEAADGGRAIVSGNERVLRARLSDAQFFWDKDRQQPLDHFASQLAQRVFHARLGSMAERVDRIAALARHLAPLVGAEPTQADRAARLAKADLSTGMVGEFPELQGLMGRYYALAQGEPAAIADAVAEHYAPQGPSDRCPSQPVSVAVALADKLDLLAGFFAIDERPTGSRDPFGLRRAALGILRLVTENRLRLGLTGLFDRALQGYGRSDRALSLALLDFLADRLKVYLRERGVRHDLIQAVFAIGDQREDDVIRLAARVDALSAFLGTDTGADLLAAYRRAVNILRIEEKRDGRSFDGRPERDRLVEAPEIELYDQLGRVRDAADRALNIERFEDAMAAFGALRGPVDRFFNEVTVNAAATELRDNRLRLLNEIRATFGRVADFGAIEG